MAGKIMQAATAVLLREGSEGPEVLLVRRDSRIAFAGGHWVFPGGKVDAQDREEGADELVVARRTAVRETLEEAGLEVDPKTLVPLSHWTPPDIAPKRYLTWFFVAQAPAGTIRIDDHEIRDHAWMRPRRALELRNEGSIELSPPTWVTLEHLTHFASVADGLCESRESEPERFITRIAKADGGAVALWEGDAGYEEQDADRPGGRHRLWMHADGWRYERS